MKKKKIDNLAFKKITIANLKGGITDPCLTLSDSDDRHILPATELLTCPQDCKDTNDQDCQASNTPDCTPPR